MHNPDAQRIHDLRLCTHLIDQPGPYQQLAQLDAAGCTKVYCEKASAATAERPQLMHAIGALDAGAVLMVTATDRLARNTRDR